MCGSWLFGGGSETDFFAPKFSTLKLDDLMMAVDAGEGHARQNRKMPASKPNQGNIPSERGTAK